MKTTLLRILLPLLILGAGVGVSRWIATLSPSAERKAVEKPPVLVEVQLLRAEARKANIEATGLVTPAQQVLLIPQVTGEVVYVSPSMVPGGDVKKGELLVRIDARDYALAVEQHQGELRSAALQVEQEQAQQELARHEWAVLGEDGTPPPLFSRESQAEAAKAKLESGQRGLDRAKLNLSRTTLRAPFDATVVAENVDVGQVVGPASQLAQLIGTGEMWVMVSIPVEELELLQIPGVNASEGSIAQVSQRLSHGKSIVRSGRVTRLVDKLDERTRRAQVVVSIDGALDPSLGLPLLSGAHVQVQIEGRHFDRVYGVPREAVYEGNRVWLVRDDSTLVQREITSAWGDGTHVYVSAGLEDGEQLALTRISSPITGMKVATAQAPAQKVARPLGVNPAQTSTPPTTSPAPLRKPN